MPDAHCHREPSTEVSNNECQTMHMPFPVQDRALSRTLAKTLSPWRSDRVIEFKLYL